MLLQSAAAAHQLQPAAIQYLVLLHPLAAVVEELSRRLTARMAALAAGALPVD